MKTKINDLAVSPEMIVFLTKKCPQAERNDSILISYVEKLVEIQDYLCRNISQLPDTDTKQLAVFFETIVFIKDDLKELNSLLPVININD